MSNSSHNTKPGAIIIEGHVQGLSNTRSLGEAGIPVYVVDKTNCIARYSKYCKKFFKSPDFNQDDFADFLIDLAKDENIRDWILLPSNDHAVYTISKHKELLQEYYKVITPGLDVIDKIYDKLNLIKIAESLKIPVPETYILDFVNEPIHGNLKFPVLIKGRHGLSFYRKFRKKVFLVRNQRNFIKKMSLIRKKAELSNLLIQEMIPLTGQNKTISFTAFCDKGEIKAYWSGEKIREHPYRFGTATFAGVTYNEVCRTQSEKLIRALNYTGVCEIEYLRDPRNEEYKLIELNPRTWLWVGLARAAGVDYAKLIYDFVNGKLLDYPIEKIDNIYWINPITDTFFSLITILKFRLNIFSYINSLVKTKKVNALFARGDMKPGWAYLLGSLFLIRNR